MTHIVQLLVSFVSVWHLFKIGARAYSNHSSLRFPCPRKGCPIHDGDDFDGPDAIPIGSHRLQQVWYRFWIIMCQAHNLVVEKEWSLKARPLLVCRQLKLQKWNMVQLSALGVIKACLQDHRKFGQAGRSIVANFDTLPGGYDEILNHVFPVLRRVDLGSMALNLASDEDREDMVDLPFYWLGVKKGYWGTMAVCREVEDGKTDCETRGDDQEDWAFCVEISEHEQWWEARRLIEGYHMIDEGETEEEETEDEEGFEEDDEEDENQEDEVEEFNEEHDRKDNENGDQADNDDHYQEVDANLSSYPKTPDSSQEGEASSTSSTAATDGGSAGHMGQSD